MQRAIEEAIELFRKVGHEARDAGKTPISMFIEQLREAGRVERETAGQHLVDHDAYGPKVGAAIDRRCIVKLLGAAIQNRSNHGARTGERDKATAQIFCDSK